MKKSVIVLAVIPTLAFGASCLVDPYAVPKQIATSSFGKIRCLKQYNGKCLPHWGVDFQARNPSNWKRGADTKAMDNATIIGAGFWGSGYGNRIVMKRDNGDLVIYSHLEKVRPDLKSGGGTVGFRSDAGSSDVGTARVNAGEVIGIAGGTQSAQHSTGDIHGHIEYVTGYSSPALRGAGTTSSDTGTRSRYYRDVRKFMCTTPEHAEGALPVVAGTGGAAPAPSSPDTAQTDWATEHDTQVAEDERYGMPDVPPYADYEGMSESQIIDAETTRRALDSEWEAGLVSKHNRGLWMEITRMEGVRLWIKNRLAEKWARVESMYAALLAQEVNQFYVPALRAQRAELQRMTMARRVQ